MNRQIQFFIIIGLVSTFFISCEKRREDQSPFEQKESITQQLIILVDTSGSFVDKIDTAYRFISVATGKFFLNGEPNSRLLVSQLSASSQPIWEGSPKDIKRQFSKSEDLRAFVNKTSQPNASYIYKGIIQSLELVLSDSSITEETTICIMILSDMLDNSPNSSAEEQDLLILLNQLKKQNPKAGIGIYWTDNAQTIKWRTHLKKIGIPHTITSEITDNPAIPDFN